MVNLGIKAMECCNNKNNEFAWAEGALLLQLFLQYFAQEKLLDK
jgi:hypothetical protein